MSKKSKIITTTLALILTIIFITGFTYIFQERSFVYSDDIEKYSNNEFSSNSSNDYVLGLIGDSWVVDEKLDQHITNYFAEKDVNLLVKSVGFTGHKTKEILQKFDTDEALDILNDKSIKHVVLLAGVNDSASHIGSDYYAHHMQELIKVLHDYDKVPVILELPEYGIEEPKPLKSSIKHGLYRYLFDEGQKDVISEYRQHFSSTADDNFYEFVSFDDFISDYHQNKNLYKDNFHLTNEGNKLLGEYIAERIYKLTED